MVAPYSGAMLGMVARSAMGSGGSIEDGERGDAFAIKLDKLSDDALLTQHLRDRENQVGGSGAFGQSARQLEPHHLRQQHRRRLSEHARLRLDAADAPSDHAEPV